MAVKINFSLTDEKYNFKSEEDFINWSFSNIKEVENNEFIQSIIFNFFFKDF